MSYDLLVEAAYTLLAGVQNGIVAWLLREYVPSKRLDWINAALHTGGVLIYAVVVAAAAGRHPLGWAWAWLLRWLLFDVVVMLTYNYINYREGRPWEPLFTVGTAAVTDRATRWVAGRLHLNPSTMRLASWVLAAGLAITLAIHF